MNKILLLLLISLASCAFFKETNILLGNVYSYEKKCKIKANRFLNGVRIEEVSQDSLYVNFFSGHEIFWKETMIYNKELKLYQSKNKITLYNKKFKKREAYAKMKIKSKKILISFNNEYEEYIFSYKDFINKKEIRNVYYSEDGYKLCK